MFAAKKRAIDEAEFDRMAVHCAVNELTVPEILRHLTGSGLIFDTFYKRVLYHESVARSET